MTSNKSFADWGEVFNDQVLATAILDRLLHHATTVNIKGDSYRLREKKKAGLLGRKPKPAEPEEVGVPGVTPDGTRTSVNRGHLTSVFSGQLTSALTRATPPPPPADSTPRVRTALAAAIQSAAAAPGPGPRSPAASARVPTAVAPPGVPAARGSGDWARAPAPAAPRSATDAREELRIDPIRLLLLRFRDELHLERVHHVDLRPESPQQVDNPRRLVASFDRDPHAPRRVAFHDPGQPVGVVATIPRVTRRPGAPSMYTCVDFRETSSPQ